MSAPVSLAQPIKPVAVHQGVELTPERFALRCWARAQLYQMDEFDLHEAVDVLQTLAQDGGLVAAVGQDEVQRIMAEAFAAVRDDSGQTDDDAWIPVGEAAQQGASTIFPFDNFERLCFEADKKAQTQRDREATKADVKRPVLAQSTIDATIYVFSRKTQHGCASGCKGTRGQSAKQSESCS
jgi:hypothetical protein